VNQTARDRLAAATGVVALALALAATVIGRVDFGTTFSIDGDDVRIESVGARSPAAREGFEPGMRVISLDGLGLLTLPSFVYEENSPDGTYPAQTPRVSPLVPTAIHFEDGVLQRLVVAPVTDLTAVRASLLERPAELIAQDPAYTFVPRNYTQDLREATLPLFAGILVMIVGGWWLATGRGGESLRSIAVPLAVGTALPLLVQPLAATWSPPAVLAAGLLAPFGLGILGLSLADRVSEDELRGVARMAAVGCAGGAMVVGAAQLQLPPSQMVGLVWGGLGAAAVLLPGLAAAGPLRNLDGLTSQSGRLLQSAELAAAGATPVMSLATGSTGFLLLPLSAWLIALVVAGRSTIRPLARLAVRAQLQRDLIVAATEAERARVAADIHDDALQELTLLVRRLDDRGDTEGSEIARTVSDRLRAICGDLRLPILDDLGVGPALDWLVLRIERLSGGEVRLERSDGTRPPPEVELAIFRVAQEALGNAVKHGRPPIVVRYHATAAGASLSVDDAGPGIAEDAAALAEHDGRFGILNMQQRAEQIGAILDVRRWPAGGTHVALEWRPR